ncbi:MAG TPA: 50S ribosomal protein L18 [Planctomycetota bacterium]|nr:50S ribosomal protein L18 [Planctomycetota bacterium]
MDNQKAKWVRRWKRHRRVRKTVHGTAERPRLSVCRSLQHIYCQLIDDEQGKTLLAASTMAADVRSEIGYGGNVKAATLVGKALAEKALSLGIKQVVMDRGGCKFHGRVAAVAIAAREAGLKV